MPGNDEKEHSPTTSAMLTLHSNESIPESSGPVATYLVAPAPFAHRETARSEWRMIEKPFVSGGTDPSPDPRQYLLEFARDID